MDILLLEAGQVSLQNEVVAVLLNVGLELAEGVVGEERALQLVKIVERIEIGNIVILRAYGTNMEKTSLSLVIYDV